MKKRLLIAIPATVLVLCLMAGFIWWYSPVRFLRGLEADDILYIEVFCGSTAEHLRIEDPDDIAFILSDLQSVKAHRVSYEQLDGFGFSLAFYSIAGERVGGLILNSSHELREGNTTYRADSAFQSFSHLEQILGQPDNK